MENILNAILGNTISTPHAHGYKHNCNCGCTKCKKKGFAGTDVSQSELNEDLGWRRETSLDLFEQMQSEASDGSDLVQIGGVDFAPLPKQWPDIYWPLVSTDPKGNLITYRKSNNEIRKYKGRAFLDKRDGYRHHMAVDLYAREGDPVIACEDGIIRSFYHFYRGVYALFVDHGHVVINYGEVAANSLKRCFGIDKVGVGTLNIPVKAGQTIAYVGKMYHSSMLHFEMYRPGTMKNERWCWKNGGECKKGDTVGLTPPPQILNPTKYLFYLKNYGQVANNEIDGESQFRRPKQPIKQTAHRLRRPLRRPSIPVLRTRYVGNLLLSPSTAPLSPDVPSLGKTLYLPIQLGSSGQSPVGVYLPSGFKGSQNIDVILYLHGWKAPCGMSSDASVQTYWGNKQFLLREKVEAAQKNVILVAPTLGPKAEVGWLATKGGFDRFWSQVLDGLRQNQLVSAGTQLGNLILSGHSGAGKYMRKIVDLPDQSVQKIREVWLFDALYFGKTLGHKPDYLIRSWESWAKQKPQIMIYSYYQKGGEPAITSLALAQKQLKNYTALLANTSHCMMPGAVLGERVAGATFLQAMGSNNNHGQNTGEYLSQEFWESIF